MTYSTTANFMTSQLNNPNWPFPIHNGERTAASAALLNPECKEGSFCLSLESKVYYDPVNNTNDEEEALL